MHRVWGAKIVIEKKWKQTYRKVPFQCSIFVVVFVWSLWWCIVREGEPLEGGSSKKVCVCGVCFQPLHPGPFGKLSLQKHTRTKLHNATGILRVCYCQLKANWSKQRIKGWFDEERCTVLSILPIAFGTPDRCAQCIWMSSNDQKPVVCVRNKRVLVYGVRFAHSTTIEIDAIGARAKVLVPVWVI